MKPRVLFFRLTKVHGIWAPNLLSLGDGLPAGVCPSNVLDSCLAWPHAVGEAKFHCKNAFSTSK